MLLLYPVVVALSTYYASPMRPAMLATVSKATVTLLLAALSPNSVLLLIFKLQLRHRVTARAGIVTAPRAGVGI
jgi:hypothetical protein